MERGPAKIMKLGVTGGIGSGKTTVCKVFGVLGIPVFYADAEASNVMSSNPLIRAGINRIAGEDFYSGGELDRKRLASLIFSNPHALKKVNSLVHPAVFENFLKWTSEQNAPYVIMEAAILFESGAADLVDRIATVTAPVAERVARVTRRNTLSREQVMDRINSQMDDKERIKRSDYVISNADNEMIIPVILKIHEDLIEHLYS
jgi:dephospho-CoA kinase